MTDNYELELSRKYDAAREEIRKQKIYIDTFKNGSEAIIGGFIEQRDELTIALVHWKEICREMEKKVDAYKTQNEHLDRELFKALAVLDEDFSKIKTLEAQVAALIDERDNYKLLSERNYEAMRLQEKRVEEHKDTIANIIAAMQADYDALEQVNEQDKAYMMALIAERDAAKQTIERYELALDEASSPALLLGNRLMDLWKRIVVALAAGKEK